MAEEPTGIEKLVCEDIAKRQALGIRKYGGTVEAADLPLREWLEHAYLEGLDKCIYLKKAMQKMDSLPEEIAKDLFTDGMGNVCGRLAMEPEGMPPQKLSGLCLGAVVDRIRSFLTKKRS